MTKNHLENINAIFSPKSIAVIGASTRAESVGRTLFSNILFSGYNGIVYPVTGVFWAVLTGVALVIGLRVVKKRGS